jgi:hypothetical protein
MSRELPERPNLDHLRKQAKVLLRELRARNPQAKLSTAQHALAREYGFASWRDLKSHVQELVRREPDVPFADYAFGRYTRKARLALFFSREIPFSSITRRLLLAASGEADRLGHETIGIGHLLLAMLERRESSESSLLTRWGITAEQVRHGIETLDEESD